jgi:hypothetical protein
MKKLFKLITVVILSMIVFSACIDDFKIGDQSLEKLPGADLTLDTIFSKAELARQHLWGLYQYTPFPAPLTESYEMNGSWYEALSDCQHSVLGWDYQATRWYPGTYNANSDGSSRWGFTRTRCWEGIRMGYVFLENIDRVPDMSDSEKARLKAEAKIIIAAKNWELFRHFGGIPIVDRSFTATDEVFKERGTIEETVDHMLKLLNEAIAEPNLPWNIPDDELSTWFGRLTKAAAIGQKCLLLLHAASPIFNDREPYTDESPQEAVEKRLVWWGGYKPELWQQLRETCEEFLAENARNGNYYQLIQPEGNTQEDYMRAYRLAYWNRGNREKIYTSIKLYQQGWWDRIWSGQGREGSQSPTAEFMEMFCNADGTPFDTTGVYTYNKIPDLTKDPYDVPSEVKNRPPRADNYYIYENRDPRLYEVLRVQKRGQIFQSNPCELWPGGNTMNGPWGYGPKYCAHGIGFMKWVLDFQGDATYRAVDHCWPILRMGGFHLIYAEALAETGDLQKACDQINLVRARVGLGKIEVCNSSLNLTNNKENLIKEILRERACELGYEDTRFMDMVRRKLKDDFTKQLHGVFTYRVDGDQTINNSNPYPELWYDRRPITEFPRAWWRPDFWTNKWYLCAFPTSEINKGWGLVQNPGW